MNVPVVLVVARVPGMAVPLGSATTIEIVAGRTALLNVACTVVAFVTLVAPLAGVIDATVGAVSVVKFQVEGDMGMPSGLAARTVAVYLVLAASNAAGVNVTRVLVVASVPGTATPEALTSDTVDCAGSTAAVKVTETVVLAATPVAPEVGVRAEIPVVGDTVLKVHV